ncbi:putative uncharacterized transposon-derived protein F52C9.6 [Varanus komodoensis]|nr:putative uncharacterized transposon-derived protein F52C9.6 [Varanus komodoensis]
MRKAGLDESPVGIKIAGRNIDNLRYADDTTLMAESEEELKSLLLWVKEESTKVDLKLNIKKTKIMASSPLTSWQIDGEEIEVVTDFIFLGSKITADGDCSQEFKRCLLLGRKAMANLDSILKSRDITLPTKMRVVKAMVSPVAMYDCESWTIRKADHKRIEAFELWCWRRLLRVPWTARRSNRSVLEQINPDWSLEGQILKMKLKYFGHLMRRKDSLEKSLMLGTIDGRRRRRQQRMGWLDGVTEAVGFELKWTLRDGGGQEGREGCCPWGHYGSDTTLRLTTTTTCLGSSHMLYPSYLTGFPTTFVFKKQNELKLSLMNMKQENAGAGLQLNIKKTKIMTTEELHNFNVNNEDIAVVKDFVYLGSVISSEGHCSQVRRKLRLGRAAMKELEKIK